MLREQLMVVSETIRQQVCQQIIFQKEFHLIQWQQIMTAVVLLEDFTVMVQV